MLRRKNIPLRPSSYVCWASEIGCEKNERALAEIKENQLARQLPNMESQSRLLILELLMFQEDKF
jgi:hypothetical protein